ncbi:hypothetical protein DVA67_006915 [Solirubrobacter sp. CPCC 204708]|uniref:N-acetylmuramoyl-L-alanine amidase domain-containing protein n=1 Tax=Solirubrobacter deserti TaxID=2282478 RepID=A0ABT4RPB8_9ACTN|nr:hypothetical protein [Solirubrobacter deserti]MBE2315699.1 hypothetical protein [Solirubrobacter deserti]MDA0140412.1 hypothetical protein [Solirubrobacter deserti]
MAQQLFNRLNAVYTDAPWRTIAARPKDWPKNSTGTRIADVKTLVVHETAGWSGRRNGEEMFEGEYLPGKGRHKGLTTQLYIAGDGTVMLGMELPRKSAHANFVNGWALGCETGHGWGNFKHTAHIGPWTTTDETLVDDPDNPGKKKPGPTNGNLIPLRAKPSNHWIALSGDGTLESEADDDLPGLKFYIRVKDFPGEIVLGTWTTGRYVGPWRQQLRVPEMVFNEHQYRSWALLARYVAEQHLLPRNFSLYPWKNRSGGFGDAGTGHHGMLDDAGRFAQIVLADEGLSRSPQTFGLPAGTVLTEAALQATYPGGNRPFEPAVKPVPATPTTPAKPGKPAVPRRNAHWTALFNVFRGFHAHGYSGDPNLGDDHDCPGPMFDWHRFAREVWDWWWWPFDLDAAAPETAAAARPYSLASRDGNTPLKEYFWGTPAATVQGRARPGLHGASGSPRTFELPQTARVYAMANGELVAARFPAEGAGASLAFVLVRHELYHRLDERPPAPTATPPVFANRIDYNIPPTTVYSLYIHLGRPPGMRFDRVVPENPEWLNRVLARKKECEVGTAFRTSARGAAIPLSHWDGRPPGAGDRPSLLSGWFADNAALGPFLERLRTGMVAVAPQEPNTLPIRVLLGDYLGHAGPIGGGRRGVRVEVFSTTALPDFTAVDTTTTTRGWTPPAGAAAPVVRYASEWARTPTGAEATALQASGADLALVNWWREIQPATLNPRLPADAHLDFNGVVHHYDPLSFLPWINQRTWRSEWPKYRATDPAGIPAAPRPR